MSLTLAAALLTASSVLPVCSWDKPGQNPYMGDVPSAVDRYADIPRPVREALKSRMRARQYDDIAVIKRDAIVGKNGAAYSGLRDMHFGPGNVCRTVTRSKWTDTTTERGLVYCEREHCIIVPTVCRNVSRITAPKVVAKNEEPLEFETAAGPLKDEPEPVIVAQVDNSPLTFETAAGPSAVIPPVVPVDVPGTAFVPSFPGFPQYTQPPMQLTPLTPAIPEPQTWALMLLGLCGVWLVVRRSA
jgi:hypothetical protein